MKGIKDFLARDWTKSEKMLALLCCFLLGTVWGFMIAPIKKGICCGNNNGNQNYTPDDEWDFIED